MNYGAGAASAHILRQSDIRVFHLTALIGLASDLLGKFHYLRYAGGSHRMTL